MDSLDRFLGLAVDEATPEQRERLQSVVPPLLRGPYLQSGGELDVRFAVADIMGWEIAL